MKKLYALLLYLPSIFGRPSQMATKYPYTHMAISLDGDYIYLYAFSRLRAKTPPISGYIEEKRVYYMLRENVSIQTKIPRVSVTEEGYAWAVTYMDRVKRDREITYSLLNMLLIPAFGGHPVYKTFHCRGSTAKVLKQAGAELKKPYYQYMPRLLAKFLGEYEVFEGVLENDLSEGMEDGFFRETPHGEYLGKMCCITRELSYRQMFHKTSPGLRPETAWLVVEDEEL